MRFIFFSPHRHPVVGLRFPHWMTLASLPKITWPRKCTCVSGTSPLLLTYTSTLLPLHTHTHISGLLGQVYFKLSLRYIKIRSPHVIIVYLPIQSVNKCEYLKTRGEIGGVNLEVISSERILILFLNISFIYLRDRGGGGEAWRGTRSCDSRIMTWTQPTEPPRHPKLLHS